MIKGRFIWNFFFESQILPKNQQKIWLYYYDTSSWFVFIHFLGHFEINWPLVTPAGDFMINQTFQKKIIQSWFISAVQNLKTVGTLRSSTKLKKSRPRPTIFVGK